MIESKDKKTRIWRHEFGTVSPEKARECLERTPFIQKRFQGNNVVRYLAEVNGEPLEIRATPTRVILFSLKKGALIEFENEMSASEWEYDNSNRNDYMTKGAE